MSDLVSKSRAQKSKKRQKEAGKANAKVPWKKHPAIGLGFGLLLWATTVLLLGLHGRGAPLHDMHTTMSLVGNAMLLLTGTLASGLMLRIARPGIATENRHVGMLCVISGVSFALGWATLLAAETTGLLPEQTALFLMPFALAPILGTILLDGVAGVAVGLWTSLALSILGGHSITVLVTGLVATAVSSATCYRVRTRSRLFRMGVVVGVAQITAVLALTALQWTEPRLATVIHQAAACLAAGVISALVALLILPLFEAVFRITTDVSLLEISDLGHPLLQRLAIEAPGTYHHSLVVANIAQAAADEIGANSLLARVCSYFHDIGKLTKPEFFAENIHFQHNPHDDLPPSMSSLVIMAHVKEGLTLAMLHKLPEPVLRVIREHHGSSVLTYFHHKAKEQLEMAGLLEGTGGPRNTVQEGEFRYPGPRPSTRESAIICLADASEAASRSLDKVTPGHIETMVNTIVEQRFQDGQLDEADLTLSELRRVKRSFVFTLTNMLHGRIPYPKDEHRGKQSTAKPAGEPAPDGDSRSVHDGSSQAA